MGVTHLARDAVELLLCSLEFRRDGVAARPKIQHLLLQPRHLLRFGILVARLRPQVAVQSSVLCLQVLDRRN